MEKSPASTSERQKRLADQKYAILLKESVQEAKPISRDNAFFLGASDCENEAKMKLLSLSDSDGKCEDVLGRLCKILEEKILLHSGVEPEVLTAQDAVRDSKPGMEPLMFQTAAERFARTSRKEFKIIESRLKTKLKTEWKPSLTDILLSTNHQVIIVEMKELMYSFDDYAYSILRQLDCKKWKQRLPLSVFYPEDICTVEKISGNSFILVTPSMPDGDITLPGLWNFRTGTWDMNTPAYKLTTAFKQQCMEALKNEMEEVAEGKDADQEKISEIRTIYKRVQREIRRKGQFLVRRMGLKNEAATAILTERGDTMAVAVDEKFDNIKEAKNLAAALLGPDFLDGEDSSSSESDSDDSSDTSGSDSEGSSTTSEDVTYETSVSSSLSISTMNENGMDYQKANKVLDQLDAKLLGQLGKIESLLSGLKQCKRSEPKKQGRIPTLPRKPLRNPDPNLM